MIGPAEQLSAKRATEVRDRRAGDDARVVDRYDGFVLWNESATVIAERRIHVLDDSRLTCYSLTTSFSSNPYARMNLTYNKATPREILERLMQDPDPVLARNAKLALERRK